MDSTRFVEKAHGVKRKILRLHRDAAQRRSLIPLKATEWRHCHGGTGIISRGIFPSYEGFDHLNAIVDLAILQVFGEEFFAKCLLGRDENEAVPVADLVAFVKKPCV